MVINTDILEEEHQLSLFFPDYVKLSVTFSLFIDFYIRSVQSSFNASIIEYWIYSLSY